MPTESENKGILAPKRMDLSSLNPTINIAFFLPALSDTQIDLFETECKNTGTTINVHKKGILKGLILVPCLTLDLNTGVNSAINLLKNPIKKSLASSNFEKEIEKELKGTQFLDCVVRTVQKHYEEFKKNNLTKSQIVKDVYIKYGGIIGKDGAEKIADLFQKDTKIIIKNYIKLQDFLLKHFTINFFLHELIVSPTLLIELNDSQNKVQEHSKFYLKEINTGFEKRKLNLPSVGNLNNLYFSDTCPNTFVVLNPNTKSKMFLTTMLALERRIMGVSFVKFLMTKQCEGLKIDLDKFQMSIPSIKSDIVDYNIKELNRTLDNIKDFEDSVKVYLSEILYPSKRVIDELYKKRINLELKMRDDVFNVSIHGFGGHNDRFGNYGNVIAKSKFRPPDWFKKYLFYPRIEELKKILDNSISICNDFLKVTTDLKLSVKELEHILKIRRMEKYSEGVKAVLKNVNELWDIIKKLIPQA